jgi:hypothetical protein
LRSCRVSKACGRPLELTVRHLEAGPVDRIAPTRIDPLRRTILLWIHILCATTLSIALLNRESPSLPFILTNRRAAGGLWPVLAVLPAIFPFLVSFMLSRDNIPTRKEVTLIFVIVLLGGTAVGVWFMSSTNSITGILTVSLLLAVGFGLIGSALDAYARRLRDA